MASSLPNESFVPVTTNRLIAATVAWTCGARFSKEMAADNAFCVRQESDPVEAYGAEERIQFADRYGGAGVGHAGGSGRCATFGNLQIKGVGRTPLVTPKADRFHSSGTISLAEAGQEVIWSQLLSVVLPHGVVSPLAVVLSKNDFPRRNPDGIAVSPQRTLLMREFTLRPAHYLRNIYFKSPKACIGTLCQDASRTRDAINTLHLGFEEVFGNQLAGTTGIEKINLGLRIMAKRFAAQIAASFAKRIFHGAINCSNIALDGRFLDFGVTAFVEGYRRRTWANGWLDQWSQQGAVLRTLHLLRFNLQKYLPGDSPKSLISEAELVAEFQTAFSGRLEIEMLKMTGVPEDAVAIYPLGDRRRLFRCMRNIYSRGAGETFTNFDADADTAGTNPPPRRGGQFDLNVILSLASTCASSSDLDRTLTDSLSDAQLRKEFALCYGDFVDLSVSRLDPDSRQATRIYTALQAIRLNADLSFLKREVLLDEKLAVFDANPEGFGAFVDATVHRGKYFLQQDHPDLPGHGATDQIGGLMKMGEAMSTFAMAKMSASSVSPLAVAGMKTLVEGKRT